MSMSILLTYCGWFVHTSQGQPPFGCRKPMVNTGINYQPQLVPDFFHLYFSKLDFFPEMFNFRYALIICYLYVFCFQTILLSDGGIHGVWGLGKSPKNPTCWECYPSASCRFFGDKGSVIYLGVAVKMAKWRLFGESPTPKYVMSSWWSLISWV